MTDYAKIEIKATYADNSNYDPALSVVEFPPDETTPTMHTYFAKIKADDGDGSDGSGTKIDLAHWTTVKRIIVKNLGTAKVAVVFTVVNDADLSGLPAPAEQAFTLGGATSGENGGVCILTDIAPSGDLELVANGVDSLCAVWITGTI